MKKHKDKQYGTLKGQPPIGPRQHLLDQQEVRDKNTSDQDRASRQSKTQTHPEQTHGQGRSQRYHV